MDDDTDGFAFPVRTKRLGGGEPMMVVYAVRLSNVADAKRQLVMRHQFTDEEILGAYPISNSTFDALQFDKGDCCLL